MVLRLQNNIVIVSKIIPPFFTIKEVMFESLHLPLAKGSSTSNQAFLLRRKDVTALLGARNRYAIRLSDHQRSTPCHAGWDRMGIRYITNTASPLYYK